ncbi:hypothetical protein PBRA_007816 [Plasmodiophora brassicae]|uniref:Uncharacterized protein n=1 Tax=Plasmodiophora brassicae TaxID=37360 RepID=A0A0G4IXT7_PLABS|nr:hypothetical protein PBRA_007816 [Plasmodiophora brassicae]
MRPSEREQDARSHGLADGPPGTTRSPSGRMAGPSDVVHLVGSSGARRRITSDVVQRSGYIQGMIDFGVDTDGNISVRVPLDDNLLDPLIDVLGCGAVAPERFEQATLLQLLPALYYLQAPDDMIDSICWTVGQTLAIPDDQWSSSRVEHQWQQHTRTVGLADLPGWVVGDLTCRLARLAFRDTCCWRVRRNRVDWSRRSVWGTLRQDWFSNLPQGTAVYDLILDRNRIETIQGKRIFERLSSLRLLSLCRNRISTIAPGAFEGLPSLSTLVLAGNRISTIEQGTFNGLLSSLQELYLENNSLLVVPDGVFAGMSLLSHLSLSSNQISRLATGTFKGLPALTHLYLRQNRIRAIDDGAFEGLSSLQTLDLHSNCISSRLSTGTFKGLSALTYLNLICNQIAAIDEGAFDGLSSLTKLFLGGNRISSRLTTGTFKGLSALSHLDLGGNLIVTIDEGAFDGLSSLQILTLGNIRISSRLATGTFKGLSALTHLDLGSNGIATIDDAPFGALSSLFELDLQFSLISAIAKGAFQGLSSIGKLVLTGNPICDAWADDQYVAR